MQHQPRNQANLLQDILLQHVGLIPGDTPPDALIVQKEFRQMAQRLTQLAGGTPVDLNFKWHDFPNTVDAEIHDLAYKLRVIGDTLPKPLSSVSFQTVEKLEGLALELQASMIINEIQGPHQGLSAADAMQFISMVHRLGVMAGVANRNSSSGNFPTPDAEIAALQARLDTLAANTADPKYLSRRIAVLAGLAGEKQQRLVIQQAFRDGKFLG